MAKERWGGIIEGDTGSEIIKFAAGKWPDGWILPGGGEIIPEEGD